MNWTTDAPTEPGWYWQRWTPTAEECVYVFHNEARDTLMVRTVCNAAPIPMSEFKGCYWGGRLCPPS